MLKNSTLSAEESKGQMMNEQNSSIVHSGAGGIFDTNDIGFIDDAHPPREPPTPGQRTNFKGFNGERKPRLRLSRKAR